MQKKTPMFFVNHQRLFPKTQPSFYTGKTLYFNTRQYPSDKTSLSRQSARLFSGARLLYFHPPFRNRRIKTEHRLLKEPPLLPILSQPPDKNKVLSS